MRHLWCANQEERTNASGRWAGEILQTKYTTKAKGGEEDACIKVNGDVLRFDSCLRAGGANGPQEADATVSPELEVPVHGIIQHFSSKEQEEVKISFLALRWTVEAARHIKVMKGWHTPHFDTSGVAIEESLLSPGHPKDLLCLVFLIQTERERVVSHISLSHNLCNISKHCL